MGDGRSGARDAAVRARFVDRETGETFSDAVSMVNAYLIRFGRRAQFRGRESMPQLDAGGYAQLRRGTALIAVRVFNERGVLVIQSPVASVPDDGAEPLLRYVLEANLHETADASFALLGPRRELIVRAMRQLAWLDYAEFEDLLVTVGRTADRFDDELREKFGTSRPASSS